MRNISKKALFLLFLLCLLISILGIHNPISYSQGSQNLQINPNQVVDVQIEDELNNKSISVLDQERFNLKLTVKLKKEGRGKQFIISSISWAFPSVSIESYGGQAEDDSKDNTRFNYQETNKCNGGGAGDLILKDENYPIETCLASINPEILFSPDNSAFNLSKFLTFFEKEVSITATANLGIYDQTTSYNNPDLFPVKSNIFTIQLKPAWYMILLGGFVGAFLVNLFLLFTNEQWTKKDSVQGQQNIQGSTKFFWWQFLYSCIVVIIIFLLSLSGENMPFISFKIKDFVGGIMIGLLSFPLGEWLKSKLSGLPSESPKQ
jgi:hypothetical protein